VILQTSGNPVSFNGQSAVITLTGVVYVPNALVSISGNAFMTIDPGAGTATLPPILGAMIAFDLHVGTNGVLVINPDDPPAGPMAATSGAVATSNGSMPLLVGILPAGGQTSHSSTAGSSTIPATTAPVVDASFSSGVSGTTVIGSNGFAHVSGQTSVWDLDIADIIAGDLIKGLV